MSTLRARDEPLAIGEVFQLVYVAKLVKILVQPLEVLQFWRFENEVLAQP